MNERIRELIKEAGGEFWQRIESDGVLNKEAYITFDPPQSLEKFAELIVRECIKESMDEIVADEEIDQEKDPLIREYLKGNNQGVVDAVVRFRNHFGVEQ